MSGLFHHPPANVMLHSLCFFHVTLNVCHLHVTQQITFVYSTEVATVKKFKRYCRTNKNCLWGSFWIVSNNKIFGT